MSDSVEKRTLRNAIVVLGDGETWMEVTGSRIMILTDKAFEELCLSDYKPRWFYDDKEFPEDPIKTAYIEDLLQTPKAFVTHHKEENSDG